VSSPEEATHVEEPCKEKEDPAENPDDMVLQDMVLEDVQPEEEKSAHLKVRSGVEYMQ